MYDYCTDVEYHITKAEDLLEYLINANTAPSNFTHFYHSKVLR